MGIFNGMKKTYSSCQQSKHTVKLLETPGKIDSRVLNLNQAETLAWFWETNTDYFFRDREVSFLL